MGCTQELMNQDTWLVDFLSAEPSWQLTGDVLVLTAGTTVLTLRAT
jgi:heat shock protein HslJ